MPSIIVVIISVLKNRNLVIMGIRTKDVVGAFKIDENTLNDPPP